jgi:hypothetical protein
MEGVYIDLNNPCTGIIQKQKSHGTRNNEKQVTGCVKGH